MVSIITPFYNAEKYLAESISSVLNQTVVDWELLLINDGSTDNSKKIAQSFDDKRIRYLEQVNKGVSQARNLGLDNMKGEFFCFLDADDLLTPNSLDDRLKIFTENLDVDFVDGKVMLTGSSTKDLKYVWRSRYNLINPQKRLARLDENIFVTISWMFRRKSNVKYAFNTEMTHAEDLWFFISYSQKGLYANCNKPILYFRRTGKSAMSNLKGLDKGYRELIRLLKGNLEGFNYNKGDVLYSEWKIKKIMFLSYLSTGQFVNALTALIKA